MIDLREDLVQRRFRDFGIAAQTLENLFLAFQLLKEVGFEIRAPRDVEDLEYREQRDVMVVMLVLLQEMFDALKQVLKAQQRPHALTQRILVADHGVYAC